MQIKRTYINNNIHKAFTLAEMMVILTVMSVVMAATMPIITSSDSAILGESTAGPTSGETWSYSNTDATAYSNYYKVAVGMDDITSNTESYDTASLYIKNKNNTMTKSGVNKWDVAHILFTTSSDGSSISNAGKLYMGPKDYGNVALGANALKVNSSAVSVRRNVALGALALVGVPTTNINDNVALGTRTLYGVSGSAIKNNVAMGYKALYGNSATFTDTVGIGYFSGGNTSSSSQELKAVHIGYYAGFNSSKYTNNFVTNLGYMAGAYQSGNGNTNVGYKAGYNTEGLGTFNLNIGYYAGSMPYNASASLDETIKIYSNFGISVGEYAGYNKGAGANALVAIGNYAGYNLNSNSNEAVFIGPFAGAYKRSTNYPASQSVNIGYYAGYASYNTAVAIGFRADSYFDNPTLANNDETRPNEVAIGAYAGGSGEPSSINYGNIKIGYNLGVGSRVYKDAKGINNVCLGNNSCLASQQTPLQYSLLIGQNAAVKVERSSDASPLPSFSLITFEWPINEYRNNLGTHQSWQWQYDSTSSLANLYANRGSGGNDGDKLGDKYVFYSSQYSPQSYSQMILSPARSSGPTASSAPNNYFWYGPSAEETWVSGYNDRLGGAYSSIAFDAARVFGPASAPTKYSDIRMKENIKPAKYSIDAVRNINVYEYNYRDEPNFRRIGVIAQEILKIIPEAVIKNADGYYTINPDWVFYPMINAIKELDATVEDCKATLIAYAKEYTVLTAKVKSLEKEQRQLERERKSLERQINKAYKKAEKMEKAR